MLLEKLLFGTAMKHYIKNLIKSHINVLLFGIYLREVLEKSYYDLGFFKFYTVAEIV